MKVDIISSIFGNKQVVEKCIESWFPIPDDWTVNLYNNKKSDEDGTTEMLLEKNTIYNYSLMSENINVKHAEALNKLIGKTSGDWILMLDSDAYLKNKKFYSWVSSILNKNEILFWGTAGIYPPHLIVGWYPRMETYLMPRGDSWIMLINRKFINDYKLNPDPIRVDGKLTDGKIKYRNLEKEATPKTVENIRIAGDVGWQFYSMATQLNVYKNIPPNILEHWKHVGHASCDPNKKL